MQRMRVLANYVDPTAASCQMICFQWAYKALFICRIRDEFNSHEFASNFLQR